MKINSNLFRAFPREAGRKTVLQNSKPVLRPLHGVGLSLQSPDGKIGRIFAPSLTRVPRIRFFAKHPAAKYFRPAKTLQILPARQALRRLLKCSSQSQLFFSFHFFISGLYISE